MTREQFITVVHAEPVEDDLDRANCQHAGEIGHWGCGVCKEHGKPVFTCQECFGKRIIERISQ